ncbi:proton-translocating NADH-quinone oxidoreductase, chain N [Gleimia coleocanis DSM 15436]|uniref:NADH-quinone oxidoreductase subunit N n=1 Tax=Gleimia coleocanis DSM 15436 TaxID=525245 RepID=C0VYY0_9ACTO|nr:NADH-quinone oxidoreductase subunit NuoN [Gleimia coleocanis]EEH64633.1 proton-translocating NADH-quinone oxidoreductase, chain N [Gleimia coleocanis DSM 15436]
MNVLENTHILQAPEVPWLSLLPILVVFGGAVVSVLVEAFVPAKGRRPVQLILSLITIVAAIVMVTFRLTEVLEYPMSLPEYIEDPLTVTTQGILLIIGLLAVLVVADRSELGDGAFAAQPADRPGSVDEDLSNEKGYQRTEIFTLILFSLGGMMVFPAANSLVALFIALEVMSLPLYVMVATARRRRQLSQEGALKYFILGAFASAFLLMGGALLYGATGTLSLSMMARVLPQSPALLFGLVGCLLVLVGLLFKVGAAPFHAWTPDVYQGAPTPITGFMAAAVKVAAFAAMVRLYLTLIAPLEWDLSPVLVAVVVLTLLVGTFVGLVQSDIKRLFAYSSIAHAGFVLIGLFAVTATSSASVLFYLLVYGVSTIGAFGAIALVRQVDTAGNVYGEATALANWAGLGRKAPGLAVAMLIFLLSFAGIPLTGGFVGKFLVFADGIEGGLLWLVVLGLACSAVTAFYYFRLVVLMFFTEPCENTAVVRSEGYSYVAVVLAAAVTVLLGVFPGPVLELLSNVVVLLP